MSNETIKMTSGEYVPIEMHKVRVVQKLNLLPIEQRLKAMEDAGFNTFLLQNLGNIPLPESAVAMMMCSMMNTMIHSMTMIIMRTITKRKIIEKTCAPPGNEEQTLLPQETSLWKTNGLETILKSSLAMK